VRDIVKHALDESNKGNAKRKTISSEHVASALVSCGAGAMVKAVEEVAAGKHVEQAEKVNIRNLVIDAFFLFLTMGSIVSLFSARPRKGDSNKRNSQPRKNSRWRLSNKSFSGSLRRYPHER
jgi:hypothetical protein